MIISQELQLLKKTKSSLSFWSFVFAFLLLLLLLLLLLRPHVLIHMFLRRPESFTLFDAQKAREHPGYGVSDKNPSSSSSSAAAASCPSVLIKPHHLYRKFFQ